MTVNKLIVTLFVILYCVVGLSGCASPNPEKMMSLPTGVNAKNAYQIHRIEDESEQSVLNRMVILVQDLGFQILYADSELGIIIGEKPADISFVMQENFSDIFRSSFTLGATAKQPTIPYKFGIEVTTRPVINNINTFLLRVKVMRIWRRGPHQHIYFANEFEQTSLYQKLFQRFSSIHQTN